MKAKPSFVEDYSYGISLHGLEVLSHSLLVLTMDSCVFVFTYFVELQKKNINFILTEKYKYTRLYCVFLSSIAVYTLDSV